MGRFSTLKAKSDFDRVFRKGSRSRTTTLIVAGVKREDTSSDESRFGFQVKKKYGKAVVRNKLRRQLKAAARKLTLQMTRAWDVVVMVTKQAVDRKYQDLEQDLERALRKLQCFQ